METRLFPAQQKAVIEGKRDEAIRAEQSKTDNAIEQLNKSSNSLKKKDLAEYFLGGGMIGLIVGLFVCVGYGSATGTYAVPFIIWIVCGIIGGTIGVGMASSVNESVDAQIHTYQSQRETEKSNLNKRIAKITSEYQKMYEEYEKKFEAESRGLSTQFAESQLAVEVIEWMTQGYRQLIDSADRRTHIELIYVPFAFKVYANQITCNLGTFDFELKRCRNLASPLEQTALARAIASAIQLNITMAYQQDISGTDVVNDISFSYEYDNVTVTLMYKAMNGNFREVRDWN